jgi:hypothetical protein
MAKVLITLSCLVLAAGASAGMLGDLYEIPKTTVAPVIDGVMDPVWHNVGNQFQLSYDNGTQPPDDYTDLMGWSRFMYDDENLYGLLYTQDDIIIDAHANTYERDSWEVYFDGDNSKLTTYDTVDDMQLRFGHWAAAPADIDGAVTYFDNTGVEFVNLDNEGTAPSGYMLEMKLPLAGIHVEPVANSLIGFELQQNDNDGTARESTSKWWLDTGDASWNNASVFGTAILTDRPIGESLEVVKTTAAPVIDGEKDAVWDGAVPFQLNSFENGTQWPDNYMDNYANAWVMYDDANMYLFFEAWDDIVIDAHANTYERDSFEVYFDGDNSKLTTYDAVDDMQLRFGHWAAAPADIDGAVTYFDNTGVEFVNLPETDLGWNLEVKLPLAGIHVEPVADGEFGFEVQTNDNDGTARESTCKWWLETGDASWNNASVFGTAYTSGRATAVEESAPLVRAFGLAQNYPNPFNPVTTIPYSLKNAGKVRLSVVDMMGKEVAVLVDGVKPAGSNTAVFNATNLSSGIYFYKLQTADNVLTNKMMLVK